MTFRMLQKCLAVCVLAGFAAGCSSDKINAPAGSTVYKVAVAGETFRIALTSADQIAKAEAMLQTGRASVIHGTLVRGDGGFNAPYTWHLDASTVTFPDVAIEVCDGRPMSDVQADQAYWFDKMKVYCPWGARIVARET